MKQDIDNNLICPHCGQVMDEPCRDYVLLSKTESGELIPKIGSQTKEECWYCGKTFTVHCLDLNTVEVS